MTIGQGNVRRATSPAAKLAQEALEYYVLSELSLHLSDHFDNNPRVSDEEIQRIGRRDIPSVLLDNRFLELFSKPMDEREAFTARGNRVDSPPQGQVVYAMGEGGAIFDHFELILPAGAVVSRMSPVSVRVRTRRLSMQINVAFEGFSTVLLTVSRAVPWATVRRCRQLPVRLSTYEFAWWALFTPGGVLQGLILCRQKESGILLYRFMQYWVGTPR